MEDKPIECDVKKGILEIGLESWKGFIQYVRKKHSNSPALIYRGQANSEWPVVSKLDRLEKQFPTKRNYSGGVPSEFSHPPVSRENHLSAFQEAVRGKRGQNPPNLSLSEWWALGQHHGLASPMLDCTYYPFVALFFAFEEEKCFDINGELCEPKNRAVFAISATCIAEKDTHQNPAPTPFSPKVETSYRLINQGGIFLKMPAGTELEQYVRDNFIKDTTATNQYARPIVEKIIIPNEDRKGCLKYLNKMNINRMSLFPDLDGAARYINDLWEIDFDSFIGFLPDSIDS